MVTPRDRVWTVALALAESRPGFGADDVLEVCRESFDEDDVPSRSTISNTLAAMAELGAVARIGRKGTPSKFVEK